jgi:hypothetical protein
MGITHAKVATTPDDGTSEVGTDEWNAAHVFTGTPRVITADLTVAASCSYVVSSDLEVAAGVAFELAVDAALEVL